MLTALPAGSCLPAFGLWRITLPWPFALPGIQPAAVIAFLAAFTDFPFSFGTTQLPPLIAPGVPAGTLTTKGNGLVLSGVELDGQE